MKRTGYREIVRFFDNECSEDERQAIIRWVNESDEHARLFFAWEEIYFLGKQNDRDEKLSLQKAERKLEYFIEAEKNKHLVKTRRLYRLFKYAAVVAVLLVVSVFSFNYWSSSPQEKWLSVVTGSQETKDIVLSDGSRVWLNENSVLKYPENFSTAEREVKVEGEAYFEVNKDRHRPFTVYNDAMSVQVLGTKFNFKASPSYRIAEASLIEGEIKVKGNKDEGSITLVPGQRVELNTVTGRMNVRESNTALDAVWHDNLIPFKNANIFSIAETLETLYKVDIILSPDIDGTETYSGVLRKKESVGDVLEILQNTLHICYEIRQNTIFLSQKK